MITWVLEPDFVRRKHDFSSLFLIVAELDNLAVGQGEFLFFIPRLLHGVRNDRAEFLLNVSYYFELSTCIHIQANLTEKISQVLGDVSSSEIYSFA